ncbi:hypothetical protein HMN09_00799400 [Mycena chlorophos]|uniref:Uncharacterized protein n=1 Tax=Mycena chlorophos TaxID=658473 RepID=A0A8H6SV96_MYCCL|nr:hypothetical protein HMN09_00799400 [Mycena chlorophos]
MEAGMETVGDFTVLVSPIPQYPSRPSSPLSSLATRRRQRSPSPIMVTLESEAPQTAESVVRTAQPQLDMALLSPPINTWKRPQSRQHHPARSQSAPPTQTAFVLPPIPGSQPRPRSKDDIDSEQQQLQLLPLQLPEETGGHYFPARRAPKRNHTMFGAGYTHITDGMTLRGGELVRPPPPLLRPTTFWRRAHRSGVAAASYSPASHLIRRSTFIAAGLAFDAPMHDLSALGVESRITGEEGITRPSPRVVEVPQAFEFMDI